VHPPQRAFSRGFSSSFVISRTCASSRPATIPPWIQYPWCSSQATTATCGAAITTQASRAALVAPSCTGRVRTPIWRSPSMDLKSFSVMMPWAPML
jgi:hypothetical protein